MKRTTSAGLGRVSVAALASLALGACDIARADAQRVEGGFDRTLTVSGPVNLEVRSGSGRIEVRPGETTRVHVVARMVANDRWSLGRASLSAEERIRRIEASPPIEQTGDRIRIGVIPDEDLLRNVSISYTLTVPAETALVAHSGSGSVVIEGLRRGVEARTGSGAIRIRDAGSDVTAETGSGSIVAERVGGPFHARTGSGSIDGVGVAGAITVHTGSGAIEVSQDGGGDIEASAGSGSITLSGVRGGVRATTASGTLRVRGEQTADWRLSSSSGGVHIELAGKPAFELDARSNSGRIDLGFPVTLTGTVDRRSVSGSVNGGGRLLHVRTSSGGIRIR